MFQYLFFDEIEKGELKKGDLLSYHLIFIDRPLPVCAIFCSIASFVIKLNLQDYIYFFLLCVFTSDHQTFYSLF